MTGLAGCCIDKIVSGQNGSKLIEILAVLFGDALIDMQQGGKLKQDGLENVWLPFAIKAARPPFKTAQLLAIKGQKWERGIISKSRLKRQKHFFHLRMCLLLNFWCFRESKGRFQRCYMLTTQFHL